MHFVTVFTRLECCCLNSNVLCDLTNIRDQLLFVKSPRWQNSRNKVRAKKIQVLQYVGWVGSWVMKMDPCTTLQLYAFIQSEHSVQRVSDKEQQYFVHNFKKFKRVVIMIGKQHRGCFAKLLLYTKNVHLTVSVLLAE